MTSLTLARAGRFLLDLLYPPSCALCEEDGAFLCQSCEAALPRADGQRCRRCWLPLTGGRCYACAEDQPAFVALRSRYRYTGEARRLVHAFKFQGQSCLAEALGGEIAALVTEHSLAVDAVTPVPLRSHRQRERGYNQAALLGREASKRLGLPLLEALARRGSSETQAQAPSAEQRRRNVAAAFSFRPGSDVAGLSLLLVDDVATTGATLHACTRVLLDSGAARISAITLARED